MRLPSFNILNFLLYKLKFLNYLGCSQVTEIEICLNLLKINRIFFDFKRNFGLKKLTNLVKSDK
ncbi:hypothetical protein BMS3Bbin08_00083 [bacterium BMS3Bbin08]|nr:hypothetical protein BMS3Bbin08_00083 [bacterium BMS3Bbin08]